METRQLKYLSIFLQLNRLIFPCDSQFMESGRDCCRSFLPVSDIRRLRKTNSFLATRPGLVIGFDCYGFRQGDLNFPFACDERAFILRQNLVTDVRASTQSKSLGLFVRWNKNVISLKKQINQWTPHVHQLGAQQTAGKPWLLNQHWNLINK